MSKAFQMHLSLAVKSHAVPQQIYKEKEHPPPKKKEHLKNSGPGGVN